MYYILVVSNIEKGNNTVYVAGLDIAKLQQRKRLVEGILRLYAQTA